MYCSNCGFEENESLNFFPKCGTRLINTTASNTSVVVETKAVDAIPNVKGQQKTGKTKVKSGWIVIACLGLILLLIVGLQVAQTMGLFERQTEPEEKKTTKATLGDYVIKVPAEYTLKESAVDHLVFENEEGFGISISICKKEDGNMTYEWINENSNAIFKYLYKGLGLDPMMNGGILSTKDCIKGNFKGKVASYMMADKNLRRLAFIVNEQDQAVIALFGMENDINLFKEIKINQK